AIEAEMKIEADGDTCDVKACEENATNKVLRGQAGERRVEAQHDRAGKSGRGQEPQLRALVGEAEQRLLGSEETARMRREREQRGCGSKVSAAAGRESALARASAAAITARCPRCTPSKLPMATTAPSRAWSAGASPRMTISGSGGCGSSVMIVEAALRRRTQA